MSQHGLFCIVFQGYRNFSVWQIQLSFKFESKFVIYPGVTIHTGRSVNGKEFFWRKNVMPSTVQSTGMD